MSLARRHKGMKTAANDVFFVGAGFQTRPDKAMPCPYTIFPKLTLQKPWRLPQFDKRHPQTTIDNIIIC